MSKFTYGKKLMNIKRSFGIACCRYNINTHKMEMLMMKKRVTFYFVEFVLGHYSGKDDTRLKFLFDRMTTDEKVDINSTQFRRIWYRLWLTDPESPEYNTHIEYDTYYKCKRKFERSFCATPNHKKWLKTILNKSQNNDTLWEMPKGRKNHAQELDLNCAIRELNEETNLVPGDYFIVPDLDCFEMNHSNQKAKYISKYFVAISLMDVSKFDNPILSFANNQQLSEVTDVRWMSIEEIDHFDKTRRYYQMAKKIFQIIRKRYDIVKFTKTNSLLKNRHLILS